MRRAIMSLASSCAPLSQRDRFPFDIQMSHSERVTARSERGSLSRSSALSERKRSQQRAASAHNSHHRFGPMRERESINKSYNKSEMLMGPSRTGSRYFHHQGIMGKKTRPCALCFVFLRQCNYLICNVLALKPGACSKTTCGPPRIEF